jgi:hypothetical protein
MSRLSNLKYIDKLVHDNHETTDAIQRLAAAAEGIPLDVLADALGQFQSAVYAEQYRLSEVKYADHPFGSDGNGGVPSA